MKFEFYNCLGLALIADYYHVSFMTDNGRGQGLHLFTSKKLFEQVKTIFIGLNCSFSWSDSTEDENYIWINFESQEEKNIVDEYFEQFNFTHRMNELIALPNMYEGQDLPKQQLCDWYLGAIEDFIGKDMATIIAIPQGAAEDNDNERMFMLYDDKSMKGLYRGSQVFQSSNIKFINFTG